MKQILNSFKNELKQWIFEVLQGLLSPFTKELNELKTQVDEMKQQQASPKRKTAIKTVDILINSKPFLLCERYTSGNGNPCGILYSQYSLFINSKSTLI